MADLTITEANVKIKGPCALSIGQAGEAIGKAVPVYRLASDRKWYRADNDDGVLPEAADAEGITLTAAAALDDYIVVVTRGKLDVGATLTADTVYCVSANIGKIAPYADLTTGNKLTPLGTALDASTLDVDPKPTGITLA